ncbi:MAG: hypothetical protein WD883_03120 [Candidatus Colwellbacteria bacterium]
MFNLKNRTKSYTAAVTGLFVLLSAIGGPLVATVQAAAAFNQGNQPFELLRGANGSQSGTHNWQDNVVNAEVGDAVSFRVFFNNTSDETANDTRVMLTRSITNGGKTINVTAKVWASNASQVSDSMVVNITDGEAEQMNHTKTYQYNSSGSTVALQDDEEDVINSGGIKVGNIEPGTNNAGFIVANFVINGNTDDGGGGDDLEANTLSADRVDDDSARLRCEVTTGNESADVWFEWGTSSSNLNRTTSKTTINSNRTDVLVTNTITGLNDNTSYHFRCVVEDRDGNLERGSTRSFTTDDEDTDTDTDDADAPDVTTLSATSITTTSAVLRGEVDPNGGSTAAWFEWGTSASNLNRTTSSQSVGSGNSNVLYTTGITGLSANTTYFFRAVAENGEGIDRGSILSFNTGAVLPVVTNVVTRFIDVVRQAEPEPRVEALIITLNANATDVDRRVIDYTVSYENNTSLFLTDVILTVDLPRELEFIDADRNPDENRGDQLIYNIGRVEAGERDSFLIETELDSNFDERDEIRFVATVEYNDDGSARKVVEVIDESTFGELAAGGGFTATILDAFRGLFMNPLLWLILFILLVYFAIRYLMTTRERRHDALV